MPVARDQVVRRRRPGFIFPWATDYLGDAELPEVLDATNGVEVEKVAALAPDLIIGQYAGITEKEYELLSKIAPTVAQSGDYADYGMPWDEMALNIGTAVGQPEEMQGSSTTSRSGSPRRPPTTRSSRARPPPSSRRTRGCSSTAPRTRARGCCVDLGFTFPEILEERRRASSASRSAPSAPPTSTRSTSRSGSTSRPTSRCKKIFDQTTTSEEGRWFDISEANGDYYVAHSFVTPLSIPYVLERYVPQLAAAADGDPATVPPVVNGMTDRSLVYPTEIGTTIGSPVRGSASTSASRPKTSRSTRR